MDNKIALNPRNSVVVEACAGSGKTWLLVSRIVRLLLDGVKPSEILAITFTRKASQEMQSRLLEWLQLLAVEDEETVRQFLLERGVESSDITPALLARARGLYRNLLLAQPAMSISTFHGWFMQILHRAPLNAGIPVGMSLLERTSNVHAQAWDALFADLHAAPSSELAHFMQFLFNKYGLSSTRELLESFVQKRAEWWAYTQGHNGATWATSQLLAELGVDPLADPIKDSFATPELQDAVSDFAQALSTSGTASQCKTALALQDVLNVVELHQRFAALTDVLYTLGGEPRSFKSTKKQDEITFVQVRDALFVQMQKVRDILIEQAVYRLNEATLHCGAALLEHYQNIKLSSQKIDFTDLEWQVCCLLNQSDCVEFMQYKLDNRYKHVLLDEFQDTNPLQWQILQSWFSASAAAGMCPAIFVVGDPKQSIYRFRRADARLFDVVRSFLQTEFNAHYLTQNETRRNAPAVLAVVNNIFRDHPQGFVDFEEHVAHHQTLPGYVEVIPLLAHDDVVNTQLPIGLRNPLTTPRAEQQSEARDLEATKFAEHVKEIVTNWSVQDNDGSSRPVNYGDIMVLVRKRTHLRAYEQALNAHNIPFLSSRRGGLLLTLEAEDIQALLTFLITPFADLKLAQVLKSPFFSCDDTDLMLLASGDRTTSWWERTQEAILNNLASTELLRAYQLLQGWLQLADKLPIHDLLDRIYFEGDVLARYASAVPDEMSETVQANLQAFIEIALNMDSGRYPSLTRFLSELSELSLDENESPDEGKVGEVGHALRIYTVHEAKGLEAPIVWLLDANADSRHSDSYDVLIDWQPNEARPTHFSVFSNQTEHGKVRAPYFAADEAYAQREEMNLLYVAMTRAKQALIVSGSEKLSETSWYGRIVEAILPQTNPLVAGVSQTNIISTLGTPQKVLAKSSLAVEEILYF